MMSFRFLLVLAGFFIACQAQAEKVLVQDQTPRSFGYVIGDTLDRRITVSGAQAMELEAGSLPRPGKQSVWLTLLDVRTEPAAGVRSTHQTVQLRYQIRNAPAQTMPVALPAFTLRFRNSGTRTEVAISESRVTIAPIIPVNEATEALSLRPDRPPQLVSLRPDIVRLIIFGTGALVLMAYVFLVPYLASRRAPFARAYRAIRRAARDTERRRGYQRALRALHRAFDETAGQRLFGDGLEEFFAERPRFADLRPSTEAFLMMSQREFFAYHDSTPGPDFSWLLEFSRACRAREREVR